MILFYIIIILNVAYCLIQFKIKKQPNFEPGIIKHFVSTEIQGSRRK